MTAPLLEVTNLSIRFRMRHGWLHAVNDLSFTLRVGETLGVVGESGCGKSVTMMSLIRMLPPAAEITRGAVRFQGRDLLRLPARDMRRIRGGQIGMVFQDPMTSLNPYLTIGAQMAEPLIYHQDASRDQARRRSAELLDLVGIPDSQARLREYPHQLSGGMRQRVMIAMALACEPAVLIADEPTTALDVTIQAQIVELVRELRAELDIAIIWITHDLSVVAGLVDRIMVMYAGQVAETAPVDELFDRPRHPYTRGLFGALPTLEGDAEANLRSIPGAPPSLNAQPTLCPFAPRCTHVIDRCTAANPPLRPMREADHDADRHEVACWVDVETGLPVEEMPHV